MAQKGVSLDPGTFDSSTANTETANIDSQVSRDQIPKQQWERQAVLCGLQNITLLAHSIT